MVCPQNRDCGSKGLMLLCCCSAVIRVVIRTIRIATIAGCNCSNALHSPAGTKRRKPQTMQVFRGIEERGEEETAHSSKQQHKGKQGARRARTDAGASSVPAVDRQGAGGLGLPARSRLFTFGSLFSAGGGGGGDGGGGCVIRAARRISGNQSLLIAAAIITYCCWEVEARRVRTVVRAQKGRQNSFISSIAMADHSNRWGRGEREKVCERETVCMCAVPSPKLRVGDRMHACPTHGLLLVV